MSVPEGVHLLRAEQEEGPQEYDGEQLVFEGLPVDRARVSLQSATNHPTDRKLAQDQNVRGSWEGTVVGIFHKRSKDGRLIRYQFVEVLEVTIE
jgi:hypothetical protein